MSKSIKHDKIKGHKHGENRIPMPQAKIARLGNSIVPMAKKEKINK